MEGQGKKKDCRGGGGQRPPPAGTEEALKAKYAEARQTAVANRGKVAMDPLLDRLERLHDLPPTTAKDGGGGGGGGAAAAAAAAAPDSGSFEEFDAHEFEEVRAAAVAWRAMLRAQQQRRDKEVVTAGHLTGQLDTAVQTILRGIGEPLANIVGRLGALEERFGALETAVAAVQDCVSPSPSARMAGHTVRLKSVHWPNQYIYAPSMDRDGSRRHLFVWKGVPADDDTLSKARFAVEPVDGEPGHVRLKSVHHSNQYVYAPNINHDGSRRELLVWKRDPDADVLSKARFAVEPVDGEPAQVRLRSVHWQGQYVYAPDMSHDGSRRHLFVWKEAAGDGTILSKARFECEVC